jgi:xanthine dehydrogenase accessory factor
MRLDLLTRLNAERTARRAAILVTDLEGGEQRLVLEAEVTADPLSEVLAERLRQGRSGLVEADGRRLFLTVQVPPVRAIVVGAVHISQALAPMARGLDLDVTIVDPRTAFATPERFPDVPVLAEWPDAALPRLGLDRYTALVALTHDPKIDDPALAAALRAECFYIGALGSRKTHASRVERLTAAGFAEAQIGRIHAPVGLDIGAVSPAEIAVSILAELIATLRTRRRG